MELANSFALAAFLALAFLLAFLCVDSHRLRRPGHVVLGIIGHSNIEQLHTAPPNNQQHARVQALFIYPVKSCRGVELSTSAVTSLGLKYDRLFSFAQLVPKQTEKGTAHEWRFLTQRECPRLALLETQIHILDPVRRSKGDVPSPSGSYLVIRFPQESGNPSLTRNNMITIRLPLEPDKMHIALRKYTREKLTIWKDCPQSLNVTNDIGPAKLAKLKGFLGVKNPLNLFRVDDTSLRDVTRSLPKDRANDKFKVGFADAFPVHLLNTASINALNDALPDNSEIKNNLDPRRFRANIYVSGPAPYAEDRWKRITIGSPHLLAGSSQYHVACRTARCSLPNTDPDTGIKDRNEPLATMKRTRVADEGAKPHAVLGLSMIPLFERGEIWVGDEIVVLETGEHVYEKMFTETNVQV